MTGDRELVWIGQIKRRKRAAVIEMPIAVIRPSHSGKELCFDGSDGFFQWDAEELDCGTVLPLSVERLPKTRSKPVC
jgi:hypothetical protein